MGSEMCIRDSFTAQAIDPPLTVMEGIADAMKKMAEDMGKLVITNNGTKSPVETLQAKQEAMQAQIDSQSVVSSNSMSAQSTLLAKREDWVLDSQDLKDDTALPGDDTERPRRQSCTGAPSSFLGAEGYTDATGGQDEQH